MTSCANSQWTPNTVVWGFMGGVVLLNQLCPVSPLRPDKMTHFYAAEDLRLGNTPEEIIHLKTLPYKIFPTLHFCNFQC